MPRELVRYRCVVVCWVVVHDGSDALEWMVQLLEWSFHRFEQPGEFVRIWTNEERMLTPFSGKTFQTKNYADFDRGYSNPRVGVRPPYVPYNRVCGIRDWLRDDPPPDDETVVVLEHDMVFLGHWEPEAQPGVVQANGDWGYLKHQPLQDMPWLNRHCKRPALLSGAGVPFILTTADLRKIHKGLDSRVARIRGDSYGDRDPWVSEMYAVVFAMADRGLIGKCSWLTEHVGHESPFGDKPLCHYGWGLDYGDWKFDKRTYIPWEDPGTPPEGAPISVHRFYRVMHEFIQSR